MMLLEPQIPGVQSPVAMWWKCCLKPDLVIIAMQIYQSAVDDVKLPWVNKRRNQMSKYEWRLADFSADFFGLGHAAILPLGREFKPKAPEDSLDDEIWLNSWYGNGTVGVLICISFPLDSNIWPWTSKNNSRILTTMLLPRKTQSNHKDQ